MLPIAWPGKVQELEKNTQIYSPTPIPCPVLQPNGRPETVFGSMTGRRAAAGLLTSLETHVKYILRIKSCHCVYNQSIFQEPHIWGVLYEK